MPLTAGVEVKGRPDLLGGREGGYLKLCLHGPRDSDCTVPEGLQY